MIFLVVLCVFVKIVRAEEHVVSINNNNNQLAFEAAMKNNATGLHFLFGRARVKANTQDEAARTPLIVAAEHGNLEAVRACLAYRPNVHHESGREHGRHTALSVAAEKGFVHVFDPIIEDNPSVVDHINSMGMTALSIAVSAGKTAAVARLMEEDCDMIINQKESNHGRTALAIAARNGYFEIAKELLKSEYISLEIKDNDGKTPIDLAREGGHEKLVKLIERDIARQEKKRLELKKKRFARDASNRGGGSNKRNYDDDNDDNELFDEL